MAYEHSDTSGTDDDLPPKSGRMSRGRVIGNGRAVSGGGPGGGGGSGHYRRSAQDQHLRRLQEEAYAAVLRAFTAQSGAIIWRQENHLATLRTELRISNELHLEILEGMQNHGAPSQYRDRRSQVDEVGASMYAPNMDMAPAVGRKKGKASHGQSANLQAGLPPPPVKSAFLSPPLPLTGQEKRAPPAGGPFKSKKSKAGRQQANLKRESVTAGIHPWVGRRVKLRWPADNVFYDAVITEYDAAKDLHALVYDIDTKDETSEWVDLKKLSSNDLQIIDGPLVDVTGNPLSTNFGAGGGGTAGRGGPKKGASRNNMMPYGRGQTSNKVPSNVVDTKRLKLPSLDALVKQVDRIAEEDDLAKIESMRRQAKEHEEMLRKALAEVGESSEERESEDEENVPFSHAATLDREREWQSRQYSKDQHGYHDEEDMAGSDGEPMVDGGHRDGCASDADNDHHDRDDG